MEMDIDSGTVSRRATVAATPEVSGAGTAAHACRGVCGVHADAPGWSAGRTPDPLEEHGDVLTFVDGDALVAWGRRLASSDAMWVAAV